MRKKGELGLMSSGMNGTNPSRMGNATARNVLHLSHFISSGFSVLLAEWAVAIVSKFCHTITQTADISIVGIIARNGVKSPVVMM